MAINSTIFKIELQLADLDRNYYHTHSMVLARHPSETDERMMVRVLAFACNAQENLCFGKGLSTDDEPDVWLKNMMDEIELWIEVGMPEEKRLRQASGRARHVIVYCYGKDTADIWWQHNQRKLSQMDKLAVFRIPADASAALAGIVQRTMQLQCTIQDGSIMITDGDQAIQLELSRIK